MKITERDIEVMGWILEQKFMIEKQVRRVFWKGVSQKSCAVSKRLNKLQEEGFLKVNKERMYGSLVYLVTRKGVGQLKEFNRSRGLGEVRDADYSNYRHDLAVTDIRILFHELGYTDWESERVLSKNNDLSRVPDGMIFNKDKYIAVEYESSQKSKERYREIFYRYELDSHINKVLYVADTRKRSEKLTREVSACAKPHFASIEDIQRDRARARLKNIEGECSLLELLGAAR